jgi:hypothetical protein
MGRSTLLTGGGEQIMKDKTDIYKDFKGYGVLPLAEAERTIRNRILKKFSELILQLKGCEEKARSLRMIKILQHIVALKTRMNRMRKQIQERDELFVKAYLKTHISHVDEERLKNIEFRLVELIAENKEIIDSLSCAETDTHLMDKFERINDNLREMEENCHQRAMALRKEIL